MFGSPDVAETQRWTGSGVTLPETYQRDFRASPGPEQTARKGRSARAAERRPVASTWISMRSPQLGEWRLQYVEEARKRGASSPSVLADPRSRDYEAVPVTESGSIGLYQIREI